jgi:hypothetical protein
MALYAAALLQSPRAGAQERLLLSAKQPQDVHCVPELVYPFPYVKTHHFVTTAMFVRRMVSAYL